MGNRSDNSSTAPHCHPLPEMSGGTKPLSFAERKALGAFYTPATVASILARWAIRSGADCVLEPGFGGCEFLHAAIERLKTLGCRHPANKLFGCDIDHNAFTYLSEKLGVVSIERRYLLRDFIGISPNDLSRQVFDVALGNPPYVSHHNMSASQRETIRQWRTRNHTRLSGRASLWAYFVLHALKFLKPGARMVWVLPGSLVNADYGSEFLSEVARNFRHVLVVQLGERVFLDAGAKEQTVVLACVGYGEPPVAVNFRRCNTVEELANEFTTPDLICAQSVTTSGSDSYPMFHSLSAKYKPKKLGALARVIIGTVTGANRFFVLTPARAKELSLSERYLRPIVSKFSHLHGAELTLDDFTGMARRNAPHLLFHVPDKRISDPAINYIASFSKEAIDRNSTFSRRKDWLSADDRRIPDAFLSYMTHEGPRIVLNNVKANCTNTVHRLFFNDDVAGYIQKLVAISLCTTFSQLSAEIEGRNYGSGVLKVEPSEAKRISLVLPDQLSVREVDAAFSTIDDCLRKEGPSAAGTLADQLILGLGADELNALRSELKLARSRRRYSLNGK